MEDVKKNFIENLKVKIWDPRIWLLILASLLIYADWGTCKISTSYYGSSYDSGVITLSGITFLESSYIGYLTMILPYAIIIYVLAGLKYTSDKLVFLMGSIAGFIATVISAIVFMLIFSYGEGIVGDAMSGYGVSAKTEKILEPAFWLELVIYLVIFFITVIKEYGISKNELDTKGIKNVVKDVTRMIAEDTVQFSNDMKNINKGIKENNGNNEGNVNNVNNANNTNNTNNTNNANNKNNANNTNNANKAKTGERICPNCGNTIREGKKFCTKCGMEIGSRHDMKPEKSNRYDNITVAQYIAGLGNIKCENCGNMVNASSKFCPDCGAEIVVMEAPAVCGKCGEPLIKGKAFCASCGAPVVNKRLFIKCGKCGADLIYGKAFCVNCGAKVEEETEGEQ